MKALVVEDTPFDQKLIETVLSNIGVSARFAGTGAQALEALASESFDLVCLDLHLPDMDGLDVCRTLRQCESTRMLPVMLLTSDGREAASLEGFDAGITDILRKSAGLAELHGAIKHFVERLRHTVTGRVLFVEDSDTAAQLTLHVLGQMKLDVEHHKRAEDAIESFREKDFDLVITDVVLEGGMSGLSLVRAIRQGSGESARTPVLAISAFDDPARRVELLRSGANDYVSKPILQEELTARVSNLISTKQLFDQVRSQQRRLEEMAVTDSLTGLYNRHYLTSASGQQVARARRHGESLSLIVIDVDHFKRVNDEHGHAQGDVVLKEMGRMLCTDARESDVCARFGGEEFVVVLPQCGLDDAVRKAERIRTEIETARPGGLAITASLGVATFDAVTDADFESLFNRADEAVYAAKRNGRNRVEVQAVAAAMPARA